jgi:poly(3-hydroxybutyrate) depolymerase
VNGLERTYLVHVPAAYKPQIPLPLVIMLHGGGGTAKALGCAAATANVSVAGGVRTETYSPCRDSAEVVYIEVEGLGHTWLGGRSLLPERMVGKTSNNRT